MIHQGLTEKEARQRLEKYGYNEISEVSQVSVLKILSRQVKSNFVLYLLLAAALIAFFVEKSVTGYTILAVIVIVIAVGFFQEYRAEKAIRALKKMIVPVSVVIRNTKEQEVLSKEIVPGDILILRTGEKIPADCLVLEEKELFVNESVLTGESAEIRKIVGNEKNYNEKNTLYMGTYVVSGRTVAQVLHTGMNTEFGKIASMISEAEKELPLQGKINTITKAMSIIAIAVSLVIGVLMLLRAETISYNVIVEILIVVIAMSVAAFPEGFPVVLISTLAGGAYRMARQNAVVKRMSIIETLGETTVICSDKTGTITKGEMTVKKILVNNKIIDVSGSGYESEGEFLCHDKKSELKNETTLKMLLKAGVLCNDAKIERKGTDSEYSVIGSNTEASLLIAAAKAGIFREDIKFERKEEIPFTPERKMMTVLCKEDNINYIYSKGAVEILIEKCRFIQNEKRIVKLDKKDKDNLLHFNKYFASRSFRVIALAYKRVDIIKKDMLEDGLIFLGLVAIEDSPREGVEEAIQLCRKAGIKVKMITGDNKETAIEIAREIGLKGGVITGNELDKFTDAELAKIVSDIAIFARVKPEHKLKIVRALKSNGEIVTMTGDGVNDAPALKEAHIGVAMGISGTDVSRESADLILKDDNFVTIVSAVKEGRTIFKNIQKFVSYELSCNYAELFTVFIAILIGLPLPLVALQILFMNIVTDNLPSLTLGFNPPSFDAMETKARKKPHLLNKQLFKFIFVSGMVMSLVTLAIFYLVLVLKQDVYIARTTALVSLILIEIAHAFNFRSFRAPVYKLPLFANKYLVYASLASIASTLLIIYTPLKKVFETIPISFNFWLLAIASSLIIIIVFDIWKIINGKRKIEEE